MDAKGPVVPGGAGADHSRAARGSIRSAGGMGSEAAGGRSARGTEVRVSDRCEPCELGGVDATRGNRRNDSTEDCGGPGGERAVQVGGRRAAGKGDRAGDAGEDAAV